MLVAVLAWVTADCTSASSLPGLLQAGWQGNRVCERLHEDATKEFFAVLSCGCRTWAPFSRSAFWTHNHGWSYALTDETGTREVDMESGGYFTSGGFIWHEVLNIWESTTRFLIIEGK